MPRTIAVANQKGGVGKTTTSVNLGASLAKMRRRVLLVDLDPQANATVGCGIARDQFSRSMYSVLLGECKTVEAITSTKSGVDLLPSEPALAGIQVEIMVEDDHDLRLRSALTMIQEYDYILIDCPPSLNVLTINALVAADAVLIPVQCEYYALEGLSGLLESIGRVRQRANPRLAIEGVLRTMFDGRNSLANEVSEQLSEHFKDQLFRTVIPRNVRLAEAPSYGKPVIDYDPSCSGTQAYLALAGEMIGPTTVRPDSESSSITAGSTSAEETPSGGVDNSARASKESGKW